MLIAQSGYRVCDDPDRPKDYVQSVIDALCDLSSRDPLTGLANRRSFSQLMEQELDRVARLCDDALLLMIDVDRFKVINDTHGHNAGDAVLKQLANRLAACVRPMDTVARFGGEEFAVVLPNCSHSYAMVVAERVRESVAQTPFQLPSGTRLNVSVSVGGAFAPQWVRSDVSIWVERADRQLYRAKEGGRNRVCLEETFDTVVTTEEKELLYGALNFAGLANGHVAMADQDSEADQP